MSMVSGLINALDNVRSGLGASAAEPLTEAARDLLEDNKAMLSRQTRRARRGLRFAGCVRAHAYVVHELTSAVRSC